MTTDDKSDPNSRKSGLNSVEPQPKRARISRNSNVHSSVVASNAKNTNNQLKSSYTKRVLHEKTGVKLEFPYGSIVRINGRDLDEFNFKVREDAPYFYAIIESLYHWDDREAEETQERE